MGVTKELLYYNWGSVYRDTVFLYRIENNVAINIYNYESRKPELSNGLEYKRENAIFGNISDSTTATKISMTLLISKSENGYKVKTEINYSNIDEDKKENKEIDGVMVYSCDFYSLSTFPLFINDENTKCCDMESESMIALRNANLDYVELGNGILGFDISPINELAGFDGFLLSYRMGSNGCSPYCYGYMPDDIISISTDIYE